jgi:hypothetical protein
MMLRYLVVALMWLSPLGCLYPHETLYAMKVVIRRPFVNWPLWPLLWPLFLLSVTLLVIIDQLA